MPKVLHKRYQRDCKVRKKLKEVFELFHKLTADNSHYVSKFLEVYEKDKMCGCHLFPLKQVILRSYVATIVYVHKMTLIIQKLCIHSRMLALI